VEVLENQGQMAVRLYLPLNFMNQTTGLFGNWSNDPSDDFVLPDGSTNSFDINNMERLYRDFGLKWLLDDKEDPDKGGSLFYHENGRSTSNFFDPDFMPVFDREPDIPDNSTLTADEVKRVCGGSYQCSYDFIVTERRDVAVFSKFYQDDFVNTKSLGLQTITSCGVLQTPQNGRKNTFAFTPGTMVKFECDPGYILMGEARRWCYASGNWNWPEDGDVSCISESHYKTMYVGIQTGIVFSLLIPIVAALVCFGCHLKSQANQMDQENLISETGYLPRGSLPAPADVRSSSRSGGTQSSTSEPASLVKGTAGSSSSSGQRQQPAFGAPDMESSPRAERHEASQQPARRESSH